MKTKILIPVFVVAVVATAAFGAVTTFAQAESNPNDTIIQKLVQKFGLNEAEVQAVFDEVRTERQAEMQAKFEQRLNEAVSAGKITQEQKALILGKHKELQEERQSEMESMRDLSPDERKAKMEEHRTEMQQWADENGIPLEYFQFKLQYKGGSGMGKDMMWIEK